jgi:dTDP-4-dehydrorhamnose reductase
MSVISMKILILGAEGMLGQELVAAFKGLGEVTAWDKGQIDLLRSDEASGKITAFMPDVLINAAAYNNVDKAETEDAELAKNLNGHTVGALADICQILAITLVHYSTDYVFDGTKREGYLEHDEPNPISVYGESKYLGERLLRMSGAEAYLIRTSRLFGPPGKSVLAKKSFVDSIIETARGGGEIKLVDGEFAAPTYAPDLARATRALFDEKRPFGTYHITNSGGCTWYEFGKKALELARINVPVTAIKPEELLRKAKRPDYSLLKNSKLPGLRRWEEALTEYLQTG